MRQRRAAQVGERIVSSHRLQGREEKANGHGCSKMPTIGGWRREQAVCLTTATVASFWELVKRERRLGLDVDTATSAQGWACGREEALGGALARVGVVHVMHT